MTKKELIKLVKNTVNDPTNEADCKDLAVRIEDVLCAFDGDTELEESVSIREFRAAAKAKSYAKSALNPGQHELRADLQAVLTELRTWVERQIKSGRVYAAETKKQHRKRRAGRILRALFLTVFGALAVLAVVFTVLRLRGGENSYTWVPEIIGCVDLVIGIAFTIYEQWDDGRKDAIHTGAEEAVEKGKEDDYIVKIENSTVVHGWFNRVNTRSGKRDKK